MRTGEWTEDGSPYNSAKARPVRGLPEPDDPWYTPFGTPFSALMLSSLYIKQLKWSHGNLILTLSYAATAQSLFRSTQYELRINPFITMLSSYTRVQIVALLAVLSSFVAASEFDARASSLTLPAIFKNATAQVTSLTQQLNRVIVFNSTLKAEPSYVTSVLTQVQGVINNTGAQINQIGKLPFDQISGGLTQSDIQYISTDFVTAVAVSVNAPQSVAAAYPEIRQSIDGVQSCILPLRGWLCIFFPWLCDIWGPWLLVASATFTKIASSISP
ncbi:hypothetical protein M407DRAFT_31122 [Tulasnella calospora MUT 4182]|uniref:Uncharacterized protein n=1 Tax=Tulasnella calospora MUT 4182 TaxID=1051891 RepID=A0A0C3Q655_9AGAM|nr:hypothetical protein M407DRAFT_31122 [Tulasnella calospora MUT 4182]